MFSKRSKLASFGIVMLISANTLSADTIWTVYTDKAPFVAAVGSKALGQENFAEYSPGATADTFGPLSNSITELTVYAGDSGLGPVPNQVYTTAVGTMLSYRRSRQ